MNLIREVKQSVDIVKVAEFYGIRLDRANKCRCMFHRENTASFSISPSKQIWHCFGCGKGGDVISLVSKLLNVNNYEAAKSINQNLGLGLDPNQKNNYVEINKYKEKQKIEEQFKKWIIDTLNLLCNYLDFLRLFYEIPDIENDLYVEACNNLEYIENIIDEIFINGTDEEKIWFWKNNGKLVKKIESRVRTFGKIDE